MDAKMSISNRLREVMEIKGLNIKCFSEQLNIPYRTLQNYLLHSRDPSAEVLVKVSEALDVNLNWLMRGKGEVFNSFAVGTLTESEQTLINNYRMMSNDTQAAFDISFKHLSKTHS